MRAWLLVAALLVGCAGGKAPPPPAASGAQQGLKVKVVKLLGDFTMEPATGQRLPELAPVHIFRGRVQPFEKPDPKHPALVRIVQPDKNGRFEIILPPGEYTLVLDLKDKLYLNNWLDDGSWAITVVEPGRWTAYTIENVQEAVF